MAKPTQVNAEITDQVEDTHPSPASQAPEVAMAVIYQNLVHSSALAMQNAVQQQQNTWTVQTAVTAKLVQQILSNAAPPVDSLYDLLDDLGADEYSDDFLHDDFEEDEEDF